MENEPIPGIELAPAYRISRLITGCWQIAAGHGGNLDSAKDLFRRFEQGLDQGFSTFDCADIYTGVEDLLGRFISQPGVRDRVQVHTKFVPDRKALPTLTSADVAEGIERSLRRLRVERLDLVQFHWWDYAVPGCLDALAALGRLQEQGKIRHLGLTNFDTPHLAECLAVGVPLVSIQLQYSLLDRRPERSMARACQAHGVKMLAYGVLAGGLLSDRFLDATDPDTGNRSLVKYRLMVEEAGGWATVRPLLRCLRGIARRHDVDVASVAAAWVLSRPGVGAMIIGCGRRARFAAQRRMLALRLDEHDHAEIRAALAGLQVPEGDVFGLERNPDGPHARIMKTDLNAAALARAEKQA